MHSMVQQVPPLASDLVIWHDDALLVVNKPAGLPTLVDGYDPQAPFLVGILKKEWSPLWVVHRLDRQTSGIIIFARSAQAHRELNTQFEKRLAQKTYHALVVGSPTWSEKSITYPLRPDGDRKHRTIVDARSGKSAQTDISVLERFGGYTLVAAMPRSGRTHQIRAHLAACGYPIFMDSLYSAKGQSSGQLAVSTKTAAQTNPLNSLKRLALHALEISFIHPLTQQEMRFCAPYAQDFSSAISFLRP